MLPLLLLLFSLSLLFTVQMMFSCTNNISPINVVLSFTYQWAQLGQGSPIPSRTFLITANDIRCKGRERRDGETEEERRRFAIVNDGLEMILLFFL